MIPHGDLLGERARLTPDKTALVYVPTGERFTYAELNDRAVRQARIWRGTLGLRKGDRVAMLADNRPEILDAFFAAPKSGIVFVPLGTRLTVHEMAGILADATPSALFYGAEHADKVRELRRLVEIPHWVSLEEGLELNDSEWQPEPGNPEDIWCLLYTSGTTGRPKGVMLPYRMIIWNGYNTVIGWQLREDDVSPIFTPLYHAGGLGAFLVPIITIGGTVVLHRGFDAAEVWRTIEAEGATVVLGVPTIWQMLAEAPEFQTVDLSRVRWLISGGAPLPTWIIETYQRRGVVFKQGYGMTEVGVNCFSMTVEESARHPGSIGKPLMFTQTRLIDEQGSPVPAGEVGELLIRGPHVCLGYWNNPESTTAALDSEGWLHTGDLARRDAQGFHWIAGRKKDMIISGGVNVYPAEIEGELVLHPGVRDAAVVGVPHPTWGEMGVAFVVPGADPPTAEDLSVFLGDRLAKYKIPREFRFVESLPRTAYGKVVKGELRAQYLAGNS
ncbi:MAG TPA: long-chain fatty acid--CoA ligase [Thermoanaerobaculia bacterium]|nr:long-chain fatty acid--CoA ligase [Thermoanaerobaculia bacterium]